MLSIPLIVAFAFQQAAPATADVVTTAVSTGAGEFTWSVVVAWICANLIEWAKRSKLVPWLTMESTQINRAVSWIVALFATLGVHATFDSGAGVLTITGLTWIGLRDAGLEYARQLMAQSVIYRKLIDEKKQLTAVVEATGAQPNPPGGTK